MWPPFNLKVFFNFESDDFEFSVLKVWELMDDKVRVVPAEVVEKHGDLVIYSSLEFAMPVSGADEMARNVVVVTDFRSFRIFVSQKRLAKNVALNRIVVLFLLCARQSSLEYCFSNDRCTLVPNRSECLKFR